MEAAARPHLAMVCVVCNWDSHSAREVSAFILKLVIKRSAPSSRALLFAVPAWPSLELDFSNLKPGPQESQFLDVIQRALQGAQELAKSTYTGDMAFLADAGM